MDTFLGTIFTDESAEFQNIQSASPSIDLTDWPLTPDLLSSFCSPAPTGNANFYCTSSISEHGYFEIEFMLGAGNFWGCNMNFGNSQCGIDIRQGISHLVDKAKFTANEPTVKGISSPIDNPLPTSNGGLPSPNPCLWDNGVVPAALANTFTTAPVPGTLQQNTGCTVGAPGGTSYHLASASGAVSPWQPSLSDLDMCAAAAHFIDATLATGVTADNANPSLRNCSLTGLSSAVTAGGITFYVRSDNTPRLHLGDSIAQAMCALFGFGYTTGCGTNSTHDNIVKVQHGPITAFTGFTTSTQFVDVSWHMYTAAFGNVFPFDSSLFLGYNSRFVSGISSIHQANGGTCRDDSVPTASAGNYMYVCNLNYDSLSRQMEFAPCLSQAGDPAIGQTVPTLVTCSPTAAPTFDVTSGSMAVLNPGNSTSVYFGITGLNGFAGTVSWTATAPSITGLSVTPSSGTVSLSAGTPIDGAAGPTLTISTTSATPTLSSGNVTITGTSSAITSTAKIPVSVFARFGPISIQGPVSIGGLGFSYTLTGGVADPTYDKNIANGLTVYDPFVNATAVTKAQAVCNGGGVAPVGGQCVIGGGAHKIDISETLAPGVAVANGVEVYCAGACTATGPGAPAAGKAMANPSVLYFAGAAPNNAVKCTITAGLCFIAPNDPTFQAPTLSASAIGAGYSDEDVFGRNAFTLPVFQQADQFGYLSHTPGNTAATWNRAINHFGNGLANYFTWLDAWNSAPAQPGTIRQGFKQTTRSVSPYIESTVWDGYIVGNIYDSLHVVNPLNNAEDLSWMDISALPQTSLTYTPPAGTCTGTCTYRFQLFPNLSWQDGKPVTSFDVAFSYLSLLANGAFQSGGAAVLTGVTILSPTQFDLNLNSVGPFTRLFLTGLTIFPGHYWTCGTGTQPSSGVAPNIIPAACPSTAPSQWDSGITTCTSVGNTCYPVQYTLGTAPAQSACYPNAAAPCSPRVQAALTGAASFVPNLMNVDAVKTGALYDPIANHILIGSGPWTCGTGAGLGQNCAPGNIQNPGVGQSYTLQRNGLGVTAGLPGDYFRSSGFLAEWLWTGDISPGSNNFSAAKQCFGVTPLDPLTAAPPASACGHWQQGIGTLGATTPAGTGGCPGAPNTSPCGVPVGSTQVSIVKLYININWVYSDVWNSALPPFGIIALDPVLYEGSGVTLSPAQGTGGVGCGSAYPTGGYDC